MRLYTSLTGSFAFRRITSVSNDIPHRVHLDRQKKIGVQVNREPYPATQDKQAQDGQAIQGISPGKAHQLDINGQAEQDDVVMDDIDDEEDEDGALNEARHLGRPSQLMAEVNNKEEFLTLCSQLSMQLRRIWSDWR